MVGCFPRNARVSSAPDDHRFCETGRCRLASMAAHETAEVADAALFDSDIAVHDVSINLSADTAADVDSRDGTTRGESGDPRSSRLGDDDLAPEVEGTTAANGADGIRCVLEEPRQPLALLILWKCLARRSLERDLSRPGECLSCGAACHRR